MFPSRRPGKHKDSRENKTVYTKNVYTETFCKHHRFTFDSVWPDSQSLSTNNHVWIHIPIIFRSGSKLALTICSGEVVVDQSKNVIYFNIFVFLFIADHANALAFLVKSIGLGINFILALNSSFNLFVLSMVMYHNAFQTKKNKI